MGTCHVAPSSPSSPSSASLSQETPSTNCLCVQVPLGVLRGRGDGRYRLVGSRCISSAGGTVRLTSHIILHRRLTPGELISSFLYTFICLGVRPCGGMIRHAKYIMYALLCSAVSVPLELYDFSPIAGVLHTHTQRATCINVSLPSLTPSVGVSCSMATACGTRARWSWRTSGIGSS
jgi:hypothetical protein